MMIDHLRPGAQGQSETHVSFKVNKKRKKDGDFIDDCASPIRREHWLHQGTQCKALTAWETIICYGGTTTNTFYYQ